MSIAGPSNENLCEHSLQSRNFVRFYISAPLLEVDLLDAPTVIDADRCEVGPARRKSWINLHS
jgi:hypothetical protein